MATWKEQLESVKALRSQRDQVAQQLYGTSISLQQKQAALKQSVLTQTGTPGDLSQEVNTLQGSLSKNRDQLNEARKSLQQGIAGLYGQGGPQVLVEQLSDQIPFALLPVRLETRFNITGNIAPTVPVNTRDIVQVPKNIPHAPSELWIRVYPDDVAVISHEKTLTSGEVAAGENYWTLLFTAIKTGGTGAEDQKKNAWSTMVTSFGANRAAWVALQTKPTNWSGDLSGIANTAALIFPTFDLTKTTGSTQAPRTDVMPDHFVFMLFNGGLKVGEYTGNLIPDSLIVGPDPMDATGSFVTTDNKLVFGADFDWMADFDQAVSIGMGIRIPLTAEQAVSGFDQVLVLGLMLSKDETDSQQSLEDLIDNHHYASQGFALMPQGMPTKNTAADSSGFSKTDPFDTTSYFVETGDPLFLPTDDCDGKNMADALGIQYGTLQHIVYSDQQDNREAVLMNTALFPGTLGYYIGTMLSPVFSLPVQNELGDFFRREVTGRGPLPSFRVGNQPYGILLTSDFSSWQWQQQEPGYSSSFLNTLYRVLQDYHQIWFGLKDQLLYAGKTGEDPLSVLTNILGLHAGSQTFGQRNAYSTDLLKNLDAFQYGGRYYSDMQKNFTSKTDGLLWLEKFGYNPSGPDEKLHVPQILKLVYQYAATLLDPTNLVDAIPVSETAPVSNYNPAIKANYLNWLAGASNASLESPDFGTGIQAPSALLYLMLRKSLMEALHISSVSWFSNRGLDLSETLGVNNFLNIRPGGTLTKYEVMRAPLSAAVPAHPMAGMAIVDYLLGPGSKEPEAEVPAAIVSALNALSSVPSARLQRCFTEHLDTLTYRLDSWQTALFKIRLERLRNQNSQGIFMGAYGWVEALRPSPRQAMPLDTIPAALRPTNGSPLYRYSENGGYVQAPSINHASAAALLRCGYLSHADPTNADIFAVNLSSNRVRNALQILEGIRNGQTLEALLGYQFERGLHDQGSAHPALLILNEYIYDFRNAFPIQTSLVQQQGGTSQEVIPANDVVNGLALAISTLAFPYGATGPVASAAADAQAAVETEKNKLADLLDAVKDLLTTESVYQLVMGNAQRASATINALQDGGIPPVLDSINTPRGNTCSFTHRVTVHFTNGDPTAAATNPWAPIPMTARSKIETGMNQWLASILGAPSTIVFQVSLLDTTGNPTQTLEMSVEQLQIQPIDLIYIAGMDEPTGSPQAGKENRTGASELENRINYAYRKAKLLDDTGQVSISFLSPAGVAGKRPLGQLLPMIKALKSMITDSRYLGAQDFTPSSSNPLPDPANPNRFDTAELTKRIQQLQADFQLLLTGLSAIAINASITDSSGTTTLYSNLGTVFTALDAANRSFSDIPFTLDDPDAEKLISQLIAIANSGQGPVFPKNLVLSTDVLKQTLLDQSRTVSARMNTVNKTVLAQLSILPTLTDPSKMIKTLILAGQSMIEPAMNILPVFLYNNPSDILQSSADQTQLLTYATGTLHIDFPADEWMQNAAHARPRLGRWDYIRMLSETNGNVLPLSPVQVPYRVKDSWLAVEFPPNDPLDPTQPFTIHQDTLSVTIHGAGAFVAGGSQSGLLVDDWVETIPTQKEITAVSFNYDQPGTFPPQAILLAVTPQIKGHWTWNDLVNILSDTLLRSKLRAVDPQLLKTVNKPETSVLLPALLANFTQFDLDIALDYRMNLKFVKDALPVLNASAYLTPK